MNKSVDAGYRERSLEDKVRELNDCFACIMVTGARQVGKSTMLKRLMPGNMRYVTLDDPEMADYAKKDHRFFE